MRAARLHAYGPPEALVVEDCPAPRPGPRDVLVEVHAASVNPVDCKIRSGGQRGAVRLRLPWILGLDLSGVVRDVGTAVRRFRIGDEVFSSPTHRRPGTYAELCAIHEDEAALKPARLSHLEAASIPLVGLTAWRCLVTVAGLGQGQRVLIPAGAGGVGSFAIQLAKHLGAVVTATASARNLELVRSLGADRVVDYARERPSDVVRDQDVVLDTLGHEEQRRMLATLRRGGCLVSIVTGLPEATKRHGPNLGLAATALGILGLRLAGWRRGVRATAAVRRPDGATLARIGELCDRGTIRPLIDRVFPLDRIADAHHHAETGHARGKIVIAVRSEAYRPPAVAPPAGPG